MTQQCVSFTGEVQMSIEPVRLPPNEAGATLKSMDVDTIRSRLELAFGERETGTFERIGIEVVAKAWTKLGHG
jgi:hypothetical protein